MSRHITAPVKSEKPSSDKGLFDGIVNTGVPSVVKLSEFYSTTESSKIIPRISSVTSTQSLMYNEIEWNNILDILSRYYDDIAIENSNICNFNHSFSVNDKKAFAMLLDELKHKLNITCVYLDFDSNKIIIAFKVGGNENKDKSDIFYSTLEKTWLELPYDIRKKFLITIV